MNYDYYSLSLNSRHGGSTQLTVASNVCRASSIVCRECLIRPLYNNTGRIRMLFSADTDTDCAAATGIDITDTIVAFPCSNLEKLSFYGTVDGDKIDILYRL